MKAKLFDALVLPTAWTSLVAFWAYTGTATPSGGFDHEHVLVIALVVYPVAIVGYICGARRNA